MTPATTLLTATAGLSLIGPMVVVAGAGVSARGFLGRRLTTMIGLWLLVAAALACLFNFGSVDLASIGLNGVPTWQTGVRGLVIGALGLAVFPLYLAIASALRLPKPSNARVKDFAALPWWMKAATLVTAAGAEEILYRGIAIAALAKLTGSIPIAAAVSLAAFVLAHLRWGFGHLLYVTLAGALLTGAFLVTDDLWANILGHAIIDLPPILLASSMLKRMDRPAT